VTAQRFTSPNRSPRYVDPESLIQIPIREAARLLSYNERTIRRLIQRGELHAVGRGKLRRIPLSSIRDYQKRNWC
jgi:excisionase family DNA binding protein